MTALATRTAIDPRHAILRRRRTAKRAQAPAGGEPSTGTGVVLGSRRRGESALPSVDGLVMLPFDRLARHVLLMGATGSGKTETAMRLAWAIARQTSVPVFYLDGKGDRLAAERFVALMADAGRAARVFPVEPLDGWRGDAHDVQGRLTEIIDFADEGPAAWYRDVAKATLALVCDHAAGPPRSSGELLARLDLGALRQAHGSSGAASLLTDVQVRQVRLRYEAFFAQARGALDGGWGWEDTDCAYLLLDSLSLREESSSLARFLFEDFSHYFSRRKQREQLCVLIVDEFSALAASSSMAARIEQARGFNTALVLAPQVAAGMGDEVEAERILANVETIVCHRVNTPERIVQLAGTRRVPEFSTQYADDGATGMGSARLQHRMKVDPNAVRGLPPGEAFVISRGKAMRIRIHQAPQISAPLPEPQPAASVPSSVQSSASPGKELPF
jgi:hypothetical protein